MVYTTYKILRTAKRSTHWLEKIELIEREGNRYNIMWWRLVDGYWGNSKLLFTVTDKGEGHKIFNSYLLRGYVEVWENK